MKRLELIARILEAVTITMTILAILSFVAAGIAFGIHHNDAAAINIILFVAAPLIVLACFFLLMHAKSLRHMERMLVMDHFKQ